MFKQYCKACGEGTDHKELMKQKPSKYGTSKTERFKAFMEGFFGGTASTLGASLDLLDRYVVCQKRGCKTLDNKGEEFQ